MALTVLCIGEVLWDMIPSGKAIGGAPFNVAYHLNKLGVKSSVLSRIGKDQDGNEILSFFVKNKMDTSFIQLDEFHSTSRVDVTYDDANSVKYVIVSPTAWDFIEVPKLEALYKDIPYLVFGSLLLRNIESRTTIEEIIKNNKGLKVFDVNLRFPHYTQEIILAILPYVDILKLNEEELQLISAWLGIEQDSVEEQLGRLIEKFQLKEVILTLGESGAFYRSHKSSKLTFCEAQKVEVVDTIGSGDSFLAAFLASRIAGEDSGEAMQFASRLAGFVTSKRGGCPDYNHKDLVSLI